VPVTVLAIAGVLIAMGVVGAALALTGALPWGYALLLGAMIAATDPVSVLATFKALGLSPRLTTLVEAESLFNDGTAVVVFKIVAAAALAGQAFNPIAAAGDFAYTVLSGLALGALVGWVITRMILIIDNHLVEITLTTVAAYGTYLVAERVHASGIIAVVIAGLVIGNYGKAGMSRNTQVAVGYFWEYAAFLANSVLFILIGASLHPAELWPMAGTVALAIAASLVGRVLSVYPLLAITNHVGEPIRLVWQHILVWGGLRGALSMALVLSLPDDTPYRQVLINLVFGVVLFSLLVQGTTIGPWLKRLKQDPRHALVGGPEAEEEGPASPLLD
jgi:CPA1 family monovalent cation:H+ antiporter